MNARTLLGDLASDLAGGFLQAIGICVFLVPAGIGLGGVPGIGQILNFLFGLPIGVVSTAINIPLLIAAWFVLGRDVTLKTICSVLIMNILVDAFGILFPFTYMGERILSALFGGVLIGIGQGLIFLRNSTTGGGDIVARIIQHRRCDLKIGQVIMVINILIMLIYAAVLRDFETTMYSMITMVCLSSVVDTILYGRNRGIMLTIVSRKSEDIREVLVHTLCRGVTLYDTIGGYSGEPSRTLMCVMDPKQFQRARELIQATDPQAFMIVTETRDVFGQGFRSLIEAAA